MRGVSPALFLILSWAAACVGKTPGKEPAGSQPTQTAAQSESAQPRSNADSSDQPDAKRPSDTVAPSAAPPSAAAGRSTATGETAAEPLEAVVLEVAGSVDWAKPGVSPLADEGWTVVRTGDRYKSGTQIRTGLRSFVNLQFGQTTTVSVRSATYASIDQFYASANVENIRLGVGYGAVRGGSSEGEVKCDVIVDSPVATLAKRGTEGWEIEVEPMTGRFRISLAQYGIVEAMQKLGGGRIRSREILPGQYATQVNLANLWVKQDIFDRNITFYSPEATTIADAEFTTGNTRGYGVMAPGGGMELRDMSQRVSASFILDQAARDLPPTIPPVNTAIGVRGVLPRPEGNFGTGITFRAAGRPKSR